MKTFSEFCPLKYFILISFFYPLFLFAQNNNLDTSICNVPFSLDLRYSDTHKQVLELQKFLNSDSRTIIANEGIGSVGQETEYFGKATLNAVNKLQRLFAALGLKKITGELDLDTRKILNEYCANYKSRKTKAKNTSSILTKLDRKFSEKINLQLDQNTQGKQIIKVFLYTDAKIDKPSKIAIVCDDCRVLDIRKLEANKFVIIIDTQNKKNWSAFVEADTIKNQFGNLNEKGSNIIDNSKFIKKPSIDTNIFIGPVLQKPQTQDLSKTAVKQPYYNLVVAEYNVPDNTDYYTYVCLSDPKQSTATNTRFLNSISGIPLPLETIVIWFDKTFDKAKELFKGFIGQDLLNRSGDEVGKHYGKMSITEYALYRLNTTTSRFDFTRRIGDYNRVPRGSMCGTNAMALDNSFVGGDYTKIGDHNIARIQRYPQSQKKFTEYTLAQKRDFLSLCFAEWDKFMVNEKNNFCEEPKAKAIFLPESTIRYYFGQDLNLKDDLDIKKIIGTLFELETPSGSCHLGTLSGILPENNKQSIALSPFLYDEIYKFKDMPPKNQITGAGDTVATTNYSVKFRPVPIDIDFTSKKDPSKKEITSGLGCLELRKKYNYWDELENDELWNQEFLNNKTKNDDPGGISGEGAGEGAQ